MEEDSIGPSNDVKMANDEVIRSTTDEEMETLSDEKMNVDESSELTNVQMQSQELFGSDCGDETEIKETPKDEIDLNQCAPTINELIATNAEKSEIDDFFGESFEEEETLTPTTPEIFLYEPTIAQIDATTVDIDDESVDELLGRCAMHTKRIDELFAEVKTSM